MVRILFLGLLVFALAACAVAPTSIPTLSPASLQPASTVVMPAAPLDTKQAGDLQVSMYSSNNPPLQGSNIFEVSIADADDQPVTDAKITYDIDMTNMSHGQYVVEATSIGEGRYRGKIAFLMPGPWRVIVAIERSGQKSTTRFDFMVKSK
jgi:hypothetical protein